MAQLRASAQLVAWQLGHLSRAALRLDGDAGREGEARVTSYKLQVTSYKLQVTSYKLQVLRLDGDADREGEAPRGRCQHRQALLRPSHVVAAL